MNNTINILTELIAAYKQLLANVKVVPTPVVAPVTPAPVVPTPSNVVDPITNAQKLVAEAKSCLGQAMWAGTGVDPEVACAISVNAVYTKAFGVPIGGGASTHDMYQALLRNPSFRQTTEYAPGCIIISPTGFGTDIAEYPNGHVGIVCNFGICANYSPTGLWSEIYKSQADWEAQFGTIEHYPTFLFQLL